MSGIRSFHDLVVWRKAFELCVDVYRVTEDLPTHERYGLSMELRKTARSIVYNIAEGHKRRTTLDYVRFLRIAAGSAAELETQLLLAEALKYVDHQTHALLLRRLVDVERMLAGLERSLLAHRARPHPSAD